MAGLIGFIYKIACLLGLGRKQSAKTQRKSLLYQTQRSQSSPCSQASQPPLSDSKRLQNLIKRDMRQHQAADTAAAAAKKQRCRWQHTSKASEDLIPSDVSLPLNISQLDQFGLEDIMRSGQIYEFGQDYPQDLKSAFLCYLAAAQKDFPPAKYKLAKMYEKGLAANLKPNYKQAMFWMHQAAKQGLPEAMLEFAHYFKDGELTAKDHALYVFWLTKAAQNSLVSAQQELSHLYMVGDIVEQDFDKASEWLEIAEQQVLYNTEKTVDSTEPAVYKLEYASDVTAPPTKVYGLDAKSIVDTAEANSECADEDKSEADAEIEAALEKAWSANMAAAANAEYNDWAEDFTEERAGKQHNWDDIERGSNNSLPKSQGSAAVTHEPSPPKSLPIVTQNPYNTSQHTSLNDVDAFGADASRELSKFALSLDCTADAALLYHNVSLEESLSAFMQQSFPIGFMARHSNTKVFASDVDLDTLLLSPKLQTLLKKAQHGDIEAQLALAHKYIEGYNDGEGEGLKPNLHQAITWLGLATNSGSQKARQQLGKLCFEQSALLDNSVQQQSLLTIAAQNNYIPAQFKLGLMYLIGRDLSEEEWIDPHFVLDLAKQATESTPELIGVSESSNEPHKRVVPSHEIQAVEHAARGAGAVKVLVPHGNSELICDNSSDGSPVVVKDVAQAVYWLERAAKHGLLPAFVVLGLLYSRGKYRNMQRSLQCLQLAVQYSELSPFTIAAQLKLGQHFERGWGVNVDYAQALHWYEQAKAAGSVQALVRLGWMYYHGYGVEQSFVKAKTLFSQAAQRAECTGQYALGLMYKHGYSVVQDHYQAFSLFSQAAIAHEKHALYELAQSYELGFGVRVDNVLAWRYLEESAYLGCAKAQFALGCRYRDGKQQVSELSLPQEEASVGAPDMPRALFWFTQAAQHGLAQAQYALGNIYQSGLGGEVDYAQARRCFTQAVNQHYLAAYISLGRLYEQGLGVDPDPQYAKELYTQAYLQGYRGGLNSLDWEYQQGLGFKANLPEAIKLYEQAAAQGSASALNKLGWFHQKGIGLPVNYAKAAELYQRAVNLDHLGAMNNLAWLYQKGLGVKKDYAQALRLYRIAAERNYPNARISLGWMYEHGLGVAVDQKKAYKYYQQAADQNLPNAMFYMGRCYENGIGVKPDLSIAQGWYSKAASMGNLNASKALERLWQHFGRCGGL